MCNSDHKMLNSMYSSGHKMFIIYNGIPCLTQIKIFLYSEILCVTDRSKCLFTMEFHVYSNHKMFNSKRNFLNTDQKLFIYNGIPCVTRITKCLIPCVTQIKTIKPMYNSGHKMFIYNGIPCVSEVTKCAFTM